MKRKNVFVCTLLIGCMLLTACGSSATANTTTETTTITDTQTATTSHANQFQSLTQENENTVVGMIQSIDGSTITIATMNMPSNDMPQMPAGEMPSGDMPQMPEMGEKPDGEMKEIPNGEAPSGDMPQMPEMGNMGNMMDNAATQTIAVTESTTITDADGNAITLADLAEATMVTVQLDDDGNAVSIAISSMDMNTMPAPMSE